MNQKKHEMHGILLEKISRLRSMSQNIQKVYLLSRHMKFGLLVVAVHAVANFGNLQYYLWRHHHSSNSGPWQVIIMTEDQLQNISQVSYNQHKKAQYQSAFTVNHSGVSLLRTRCSEFALF